MGGERFDSQQPEAFLFGENSDLNFLGNRPMPVSFALQSAWHHFIGRPSGLSVILNGIFHSNEMGK